MLPCSAVMVDLFETDLTFNLNRSMLPHVHLLTDFVCSSSWSCYLHCFVLSQLVLQFFVLVSTSTAVYMCEIK